MCKKCIRQTSFPGRACGTVKFNQMQLHGASFSKTRFLFCPRTGSVSFHTYNFFFVCGFCCNFALSKVDCTCNNYKKKNFMRLLYSRI